MFFLADPLGVWIPDETLCRVFDTAPQTIHNSWRNSKQSSQYFMLIKIQYLNGLTPVAVMISFVFSL